MTKTAFMASVAALVLMLSFPAMAQGTTSEIPGWSKTAPKATPKAAASLSYNVGTGPINLRPRAYIDHSGESSNGADTSSGRKSLPEKTTSASAYNQRLVTTQVQAQRRTDSVIPSPFPPGF